MRRNMDEGQIYEKIGKVEAGVEFLVQDAKKKNGYITDLNVRMNNGEKEIISLKNEWKEIVSLISKNLGEINYFIKNQKDKEKQKKDVWIFVKENWIVAILIMLTSGFAGTFMPFLWMYVKKHWIGS